MERTHWPALNLENGMEKCQTASVSDSSQESSMVCRSLSKIRESFWSLITHAVFLFCSQVSTVDLHHKSKMVVCSAVTPLPMVWQSTSAKKGFCLLALQRWSVSLMVKLQSGHHWMIPIQHLFANVCYCLMCTIAILGRVFG